MQIENNMLVSALFLVSSVSIGYLNSDYGFLFFHTKIFNF